MSDMSFYLGDFTTPTWEAIRFGPHWNGFATPVVTREVLAEILDSFADDRVHCWDGDTAWVAYYNVDDGVSSVAPGDADASCLQPGQDGLYDLGYLGFMFVRCGNED